jgi:hypothetical protein
VPGGYRHLRGSWRQMPDTGRAVLLCCDAIPGEQFGEGHNGLDHSGCLVPSPTVLEHLWLRGGKELQLDIVRGRGNWEVAEEGFEPPTKGL